MKRKFKRWIIYIHNSQQQYQQNKQHNKPLLTSQKWMYIYNTLVFRIISIPSKTFYFRLPHHVIFYGLLGTGLPVSMYIMKTPIDKWRFNVTQLNDFFLHFL